MCIVKFDNYCENKIEISNEKCGHGEGDCEEGECDTGLVCKDGSKKTNFLEFWENFRDTDICCREWETIACAEVEDDICKTIRCEPDPDWVIPGNEHYCKWKKERATDGSGVVDESKLCKHEEGRCRYDDECGTDFVLNSEGQEEEVQLKCVAEDLIFGLLSRAFATPVRLCCKEGQTVKPISKDVSKNLAKQGYRFGNYNYICVDE